MTKKDCLVGAKSFLAFVIILVAFSILTIFSIYQENIILTGNFALFIILSVVAMGLLVSLLFLINPSTKQVKTLIAKKSSHKRKR
ncbi:MAG: hypothetical protein A2857_04790 [Candidatus Levybacteria bacterium RIFCSPHIGHO2_01_FULL_36_15]|nr:MAG: hypothetical protein A2857_04790 [Candidatus Levybacteria bacterium RIFCSPHIGHO2_01_FULL_36_15]